MKPASGPARYATIPAMESWLENMEMQVPCTDALLLLNQLDFGNRLNTDIATAMRTAYGERVVPFSIERDEAIGLALAFQQPLCYYAPDHTEVKKFQNIANWLNKILLAGTRLRETEPI